MVQGGKKLTAARPGAIKKQNSAKVKKQIANEKKVRKGSTLKLPKNQFRDVALEDREISKGIAKVAEQKVAVKLIQGGGKVGLKDVWAKGKELSKEIRRDQVKRKKSRVEEKLLELESIAEKTGLS